MGEKANEDKITYLKKNNTKLQRIVPPYQRQRSIKEYGIIWMSPLGQLTWNSKRYRKVLSKGELLLSKCNWILAGSYPLSPPVPFDHNYTCRRVKWGEHGGMGTMQHSLTTATPFKSKRILFKARALGSNLIHRRLSTSQLPILILTSPITWSTSFLSCPPTPYGLPLAPSFGRFQTLIWRPRETVQNRESPRLSGRVDSTGLLDSLFL